jgi:phage N-6-adenine-methyltransferase
MNRATRDKFATGTDQSDLTSGQACLQTPPAIFADLNKRLGPFAVDVCADYATHLCSVWFGPDSPVDEPDALAASWLDHAAGRRIFCNPPYGRFTQKILEKASGEARRGQGSVHLLPLRATRAFHQYVIGTAAKVLVCDKRIAFFERDRPRLNPKTGHADAALFDSVVVVFVPMPRRRKMTTIIDTYRVPEHVKNYLG